MKELLPDIYRIEVPLPRNPLRAINSYVIRGRDRFLVIDTGMNRPECIEAMQTGLEELAVDLDQTDIFVTHCHSDHVGLVSLLKTATSRVFLHPADAAIICDPNLWVDLTKAARVHGFPDPDSAVENHPGKRYLFTGQPEFTPLREGDTLSVGQYHFRGVETPGHTPGHLCLYEPEAGILFSGDHILDSITPNISGWDQETDPLGDFLASLGAEWRFHAPGKAAEEKMPLRVTLAGRYNGSGIEEFRHGSEAQLNLGTEYPLVKQVSILLQTNYRVRAKDDIGAAEEEEEANTGGVTIYATPGLRFDAVPGFSIYGLAQIPLYERVNGIQVVAESNLVLGISRSIY